MKTMDRRDFLKIAGAGTAALAAGAAMPVAGFFGWTGNNVVRFRAVTGMPTAPLPTYASYVIEGHVDIRARMGTLAKSLHAGAPNAMSESYFRALPDPSWSPMFERSAASFGSRARSPNQPRF